MYPLTLASSPALPRCTADVRVDARMPSLVACDTHDVALLYDAAEAPHSPPSMRPTSVLSRSPSTPALSRSRSTRSGARRRRQSRASLGAGCRWRRRRRRGGMAGTADGSDEGGSDDEGGNGDGGGGDDELGWRGWLTAATRAGAMTRAGTATGAGATTRLRAATTRDSPRRRRRLVATRTTLCAGEGRRYAVRRPGVARGRRLRRPRVLVARAQGSRRRAQGYRRRAHHHLRRTQHHLPLASHRPPPSRHISTSQTRGTPSPFASLNVAALDFVLALRLRLRSQLRRDAPPRFDVDFDMRPHSLPRPSTSPFDVDFALRLRRDAPFNLRPHPRPSTSPPTSTSP
ncbi:uncharacterized protein SCHCODRAFT_02447216, partial [Schizophyllum commune H4-8]